ncbi:tigger transposable element-derived protein 4-like [Hydra vulgaris]|uniref:Tigger transposable element-derived protein 4-like n=1 Tax=Hydra vulgaris TaxID=6087 RepID=A0ABM4BUX4_HYDVU
MSNKEVAKKYGVPKNTLSTWIKNKTKLLTSLEKNGTKSKRKKLRSGNFKNVDKAIYTWFVAKRSQQVPIDGTILKEKALKLAEALGELDFKASDCWFHNWKKRNGISFKIISGESAAVTNNMTASWNETTLPTLLLNYKLKNIFNADEFGLFYQCLPNKTYHLSREKCFGGKNSKLRLTGIAAGSATGERLPMFNAVSKETVINCFKKAGISKTNKSIEEADDDHFIKFLTEELNRLPELDPRAVQEDLSAESYIGLDCDVVTTGSLATDAEIIAQILDPNFENDDNEVEDSVDEAIDVEAPPRPSDIQLEIAFETIQNASLYSSKYGNEIQSLALKLEDLMKMEKMDNLKQYQITDFFQKL